MRTTSFWSAALFVVVLACSSTGSGRGSIARDAGADSFAASGTGGAGGDGGLAAVGGSQGPGSGGVIGAGGTGTGGTAGAGTAGTSTGGITGKGGGAAGVTAVGGSATAGATGKDGGSSGGAGGTGSGGGPANSGGNPASSDGGPAAGGSGRRDSGAGGLGTGGATMVGTGGAGAGGSTGTGTGGAGTGGLGEGGSTGAGGSLDCGPQGFVVEFHGPPANRVNYVILGDGYTSADLAAGGVFETHIKNAMTERFSALGEPYGRYRSFVNICAIKIVSNGAICGSSALGCCGDDSSRLASCSDSAVNAAFNALPASLSTDWRAVVLNGSSWWNTGAATMLWSGGNSNGPKAALHEGGHGFHQLADEYCASSTGTACGADTSGTGTTGTEYAEVNSTGNPATTGGKWDQWIGFTQSNGTGLQSTFQGSRYVDSGQYRPSGNSKMNSLFGNNANTNFNSVSKEQIVMTIWRVVKPIDSTVPPAGTISDPGTITMNVIDPSVVNVDWTVDGATTTNGGTTFDTSALAAGSHTITAKAYDNAGDDLVRYRSSTCPSSVTSYYCSRTAWKNSIQTVTWTVNK